MKQSPLDALCQSIRRVKAPRDYQAGMPSPSPAALPENILLFSRYRARDLQTESSRHHHHRFVLLAATKGSGRILLDAKNHFLREGQALLFFPYQFHGYVDIDPRICWLFITFEVADSTSLGPLRDVPPRLLQEQELQLLSELVACWLDPARSSLVALHLALVLARLAAQEDPTPAAASPKASEAARLLAKINSYAIPRLNRPVSLTELASGLRMSESHLRAKFRAAVGDSLGKHLRNLRIYKASSLLHSTRLSVTEVAEACGFESVYAFSRAFKALRGHSPRAYRARCETLASSLAAGP